MKRMIVAASIALLLGSVAASAQVLQRPGPDFYRMPDRGAAPPWADEGVGFRIRIQRRATPNAYTIRIDSGSGDASQVQVDVEGRTLVIGSSRTVEKEQRSDRGWYRFSRVSSGYRQRIRLPRDADVANMQRDEQDGVITLTIPRVRPSYPGRGGYGPRR